MLPPAHHDPSSLYVAGVAGLGSTVTLRLRTHRDHQPGSVMVRTVRDGEPFIVEAALEAVAVDAVEGADVWWRATVALRNPITTYRWLLSGGAFGYAWLNAEGIVDHDVPDAGDFVLFATGDAPDWTRRAVVYQVFPDRFARAGDRDQLGVAVPPAGVPMPAWAKPRAWTDPVEGRGPSTPFEYFGGDLDGVREHLDHVAGIGADTLYSTPVFPAGSTHRYDARTFDAIDPLLGGDDAWRRLNAAAHARGMRTMGDITLNHCGATHEWFEAAQDPSAPERGFFRFDAALPHGYECWLGVPSLPKFDLTDAGLRARLVSAPDSSIRRWLGGEDGLDAWRVDVANMAGRLADVDVTHDVARETREAMAAEVQDPWLVAEHGHDASDDLRGDGWHGTMNYVGFTRPVWCWLKSPDFNEGFFGMPIPIPQFSGGQMVASMRAFHGRIAWEALRSSWNILGSHDTARIRTVVGTGERQIAALALCIGLPGVPMVFAGDEIGETGLWGEDSRTPFPWHARDRWDADTLAAYTALLHLRRTSDALSEGGLRWAHVSDDAVAFLRESAQERLLVVAARSQAAAIRLPLAELSASHAEPVFGFAPAVEAGQLVVEIPAAGAGIVRLV